MVQPRIIKQRIRIQGFLIFCAVMAVIFLPRFIFPTWRTEFWDEILDVLGILIILFGFLLRVAARGIKKERSKEGRDLVQEGPYEMIRHPMYTGSFLIGLGIICLLFNAWIIGLLVVVFLSIYIPQLKKEEGDLRERFKETYDAYANRTPRLLPKWRSILHLRDHMHIKWEWLKNEVASFSFVLFFILMMEAWRDAALFGMEELLTEPLELLCVFIAFMLLAVYFTRPPNKTAQP